MHARWARDRAELPIDGRHHFLLVLRGELGGGDPRESFTTAKASGI